MPPLPDDPIDALLTAHGLRRTQATRRVLGWLLGHPDTSYTHAQLQVALQDDTGWKVVESLTTTSPLGSI